MPEAKPGLGRVFFEPSGATMANVCVPFELNRLGQGVLIQDHHIAA